MAGYARGSQGAASSGAFRGAAAAGAPSGRDGGDERKALTVSEALDIVKRTLSGIRLTVVGEVSEVSAKRGYKAVYFTLKDRSSVLKCLMWNDLYRSAGLDLEIGQEVEVSGFFSLYAARGTMNFDVRRLSLAGEGRLRMEVARLARKLEAEGLMDPARKRPLPPFPRVVGLVTSPHGDAVHDVLRTLRRRWPLARVVLAGVQVEGAGAVEALIEGLRCVAASDAELVILGRGGGPYETMMPFNDERLVRAVAACPIPVVTGIGHEPDNFIADMVADVRSSTPTWAAAAAVPDQAEVREMLGSRRTALEGSQRRVIERARAAVARLSDRPVLRDADQLFAQEALGVDHLAARLERALPQALERRTGQVDQLAARLERALPQALAGDRAAASQLAGRLARLLAQAGERERSALDRERSRLGVSLASFTERFRQQMGLRAARLNDLSPLAVLGRGYAIARDGEGSVVKRVGQVAPGDALKVSVSDGVLDCRVEQARCIEVGTVALSE